MTPYYDKDGITIFNGDCRDVLPTLDKVDITMSSPPYNMIPATAPSGMLKEARCKKTESYATYKDNQPESEYWAFMVDVFGQCLELSNGLVWINHKTKYRDKVAIHPVRMFPWDIHTEIIWARPGSTTLNAKRYAPSHEVVLGFGMPNYWDRCNDSKFTVWNMNPEKGVNSHPCPFPVAIPKRCIASSCPPDGVVLDPFMGSGTTLVAAKLLNRRAVGIEIEEQYCEIAVNRLRQGVLNLV